MIRRFSVLIKENKRLRDEVEKELSDGLKQFAFATALSSKAEMEKAFSMPRRKVDAEFGIKNIMSVEVPSIEIRESGDGEMPYAYGDLTSEADYSVRQISKVIDKLIRLAEVEKTVSMLAIEIERNKRRVNALEYVMIPQLNETISYIKSKLDENERAATTRLMKVKGMIEERKAQ